MDIFLHLRLKKNTILLSFHKKQSHVHILTPQSESFSELQTLEIIKVQPMTAWVSHF